MKDPVGGGIVPSSNEDGVPLCDGDGEVLDGVRGELNLTSKNNNLVSFAVVFVAVRGEEKVTNSIGLDDLHVMPVHPDVEHGESGHCRREGGKQKEEVSARERVEKRRGCRRRRLTVDEPQSVGLSRNEVDGSSIRDSSSLSEVGLGDEVRAILSDVEERRFWYGFRSSRVESVEEPVKHRSMLSAVKIKVERRASAAMSRREETSSERRVEFQAPSFDGLSKEKARNVLVPVSQNNSEIFVPDDTIGSLGLVVGEDNEGSSKTVGVLSCERGRKRSKESISFKFVVF